MKKQIKVNKYFFENVLGFTKEELMAEGMEDEEEIADYISDVTGFCHEGFVLED